MANYSQSEDIVLLEALRLGSRRAFSLLFEKYYLDLVMFAGIYIPEQDVCEDMVQNVFLEIWRKHECLNVSTSLRNYLITGTRNRCLNELEHRKVVSQHIRFEMRNPEAFVSRCDDYLLYSELKHIIEDQLNRLNTAEGETIDRSRNAGLTDKEIASIQRCSIRTVEVRIGNVIRAIRSAIEKLDR